MANGLIQGSSRMITKSQDWLTEFRFLRQDHAKTRAKKMPSQCQETSPPTKSPFWPFAMRSTNGMSDITQKVGYKFVTLWGGALPSSQAWYWLLRAKTAFIASVVSSDGIRYIVGFDI